MSSHKTIGVGMIGCGTVGSGVVRLLNEQADLYTARLGRPVELRRVLVRAGDKANKTEGLAPGVLTTDPESFFTTPDMPILIELGGGRGAISQFVRRALSDGKHVVTANKALLAAEAPELLALARKHNVALAFEASCCGGIPVITALEFGLMANRIDALYGILNGTCNYILTEMTHAGKTYAAALREAQDKGFAEADPTLDVSGKDSAHKLAILTSLAFGVRATDADVTTQGIDTLSRSDVRFGSELGYTLKLLGIAERVRQSDGTFASATTSAPGPGPGPRPTPPGSAPAPGPSLASDPGHSHSTLEAPGVERVILGVQPCFIPSKTLLAQVQGSFNALSIFGHANGHTMYYGRGAGSLPTASAVVSDVLNIASGWYPKAFAALNLWWDTQPAVQTVDAERLLSRFYIRVNALERPGVMAKITSALAQADISLSAVMQHEVTAGRFAPVVMTTHEVQRGTLQQALSEIEHMDAIEGKPVSIRIVDMPEG